MFPPHPINFTLDWIKSSEITKVDEASNNQSVATGPEDRRHSNLTSPVGEWDSDEEGELDIIHAMIHYLFQQGILNLNANEFSRAEMYLQNCIKCLSHRKRREEISKKFPSLHFEVMSALVTALIKQQKWDDAQTLLEEKIDLRASFHTNDNDLTVVDDILTLSEVLIAKNHLPEALRYGKHAFRALTKQNPQNQDRCATALRVLIQICQLSGNQHDADGYFALLHQQYSPNAKETEYSLSRRDSNIPSVQPQAGKSSRQEQRPQSSQVKPFMSAGSVVTQQSQSVEEICVNRRMRTTTQAFDTSSEVDEDGEEDDGESEEEFDTSSEEKRL